MLDEFYITGHAVGFPGSEDRVLATLKLSFGGNTAIHTTTAPSKLDFTLFGSQAEVLKGLFDLAAFANKLAAEIVGDELAWQARRDQMLDEAQQWVDTNGER